MRLQQVGNKILTIGNPGLNIISPRGGALPWWLTGGISAAACTAAWQPKGAADYAGSKVNLANPGTYDATNGTAYPTWDVNGWIFNGTQYLTTGVAINRTGQTKTLIARFSGHPTGTGYRTIVGAWGGSGAEWGRFWLAPEWGAKVDFANGREIQPVVAGGYNSGVMAVAGSNAYYNGSDVGDIIAGDVAATANLAIGATYVSTGFDVFYIGYVQAIAVYAETTITAAQVLAVTNAMNAL